LPPSAWPSGWRERCDYDPQHVRQRPVLQSVEHAGLSAHLTALKAPDLETFLRTDWGRTFWAPQCGRPLRQLRTWNAGDISNNKLYGGNLAKALNAITAKVLLMPGATDRSLFPRR
jgi:homoserine O-acetyltransferase/O-succinyltransferase